MCAGSLVAETLSPTAKDQGPPLPRRVLSPWTTADGALMEQSGRNRWQPVANGMAAKMARTSQNRCHGLRDGKERVDGSSPSEGFRKFLLISFFRCRPGLREQGAASTERPRLAGTACCEASDC